jgi:hypothetical protein
MNNVEKLDRIVNDFNSLEGMHRGRFLHFP